MKEGWKTIKLNDACFVDYGTRVVKKRDGGNIYPVYGGGGATFKMDTYNREDCLVVGRFAMSEKCTRFVKGKFFLNDSGLTVRPKDKALSQSLLDWALIAKNDNIYSFGKGSAQKNLDMDDFRDMELSYPTDLAEQQRIVDILDAEFAKIDALKANAEKNLQNAKDLLQSAMTAQLEYSLQKTVSLASLCEKIVDCPHTTPVKSLEITDFPCIRTSELKSGSIFWNTMQYVGEDEYHKRTKHFVPQCDDIVYGREGTFGDAVILPKEHHFCLGQRTTLFRPDKALVDPRYLLYCILSPYVYAQAKSKNTGCGVGHINVADIKQFKIPIPSTISEQQAIVSRLDALNDRCKALQENYTRTLALCDDLKQALLRKAFAGSL